MHYMPFFYYYSDFLVVSLKDTAISTYTLPGKVQSYMSSGKPIVGMVNGEAARVIVESGCGFAVASGDDKGFASILDQCCSLDSKDRIKLGSLGKSYAYKNFRLQSVINKVMDNF